MININYLIQILKNENVKNLGVFDKIIKNDILTNINDINITIIDLYQVLESINLFDWIMLLENDNERNEDIIINNLYNNKYGIILNPNMKNYEHIKTKLCTVGYIVSSDNNMIFRKIYNYRIENYSLCLLYNKPEHLNDYIKALPNIYDIGNYRQQYRDYFINSKTNDFMIDIGANIGLSSCPILSLGNRVVCFEPESLNYEILKYIKKYNNYNNMFIENCAVIGTRGQDKTTFYSNINREDNSSINELCCKGNVMPIGIIKKEVSSITLDEWYDYNKKQFNVCDLLLIKIDVQGGEYDILNGAKNLLRLCSIYGKCKVEIECDEKFMKLLDVSFDKINSMMNSCGFICIKKGYDSVFMPIETVIIPLNNSQLCNCIKNFLSVIRISNKTNNKILIEKDDILKNIFDLSEFNDKDNYDLNNKNVIQRANWRFTIFDSDVNLDKIIDNQFSLAFQGFSDQLYFQNFKNNCIDFMYRPDLLNDIYEDYMNIFNKLIIKPYIYDKIEQFYNKHFNEHTISVHLRSWTNCNERKHFFDINKFINMIEQFNDGVHNFFVASDDINLCYDIKQKFGDKIIIYENNDEECIINAFIELFLLSKNNILIGTFISTFTELAYIINYNINKKIFIL